MLVSMITIKYTSNSLINRLNFLIVTNGEIQLVMKDKLRVEDELLLCCARTNVEAGIRDKILSLVQGDLDWGYLLKLAVRHRLMPLLYYNLNSICPEKVPKQILNKLKDYFNKNLQRNLLLTGELIKVLSLLKSKSITVIPYKGPNLANSIYGNIALREFNDLDVFIKKSEALKIRNFLFSEGYYPYFHINKKLEEIYFRSQKGFILVNENHNFSIDFQWKFFSNFFSFPSLPESLLSDELDFMYLNGHEISVFSPENMFLILSIHAAGHHWSRLAWLCDIAELIKGYDLDWKEITEKTNELNIKRILNINLILVNEMFEVKFPKIISNEIYSDMLSKKISIKVQKNLFSEELKSPNLWDWAYFHLKIRENLKNGIIDSIKDVTVPSIDEIKGLELPNKLYPIYYVFRPFNLIKKYKKG